MPGVPIIFHAMQGKDEREASSPSFFNVLEASEVKAYVQRLKEDTRLALSMLILPIIGTPLLNICNRG